MKKLIEKILSPFIKKEEDKERLSTVIIPSFIVRLGWYLLSYLLIILLTRTLGPSRYGVFSYTAAIIFLLMDFSCYGFNVLAVRFTSSYLSKGQKSLWKGLYQWALSRLLILSSAVAVIVALSIWVFTYILHIAPKTPYSLPIIVSCSVIPIYALMNFYSNLLRGQNKVLVSFLPDNTIKPLFFLVTLIAARLVIGSMNLRFAIGLNLLSFVIAFAFVFFAFRRYNTVKHIEPEYDKKTWGTFVGSMFVLACISTIYSQLDILILGYIKDSTQVGIYKVAERYSSSLFFFLAVMNMIIAPTLARLNTPEDKDKLQAMITRTIRWVTLFSMPVFFILVFFSGKIIQISGPQFLPGKTALVILSIGVLFDVGFGPVNNFALMTGYEKYTTIYMAIGIFINIVLNLLLTPRYGLNGTAIATASCTVFQNAGLYVTMRKKTGISTWIFG